ncbi:transcriptional regulator, partial [Streptococcus agalactiae]
RIKSLVTNDTIQCDKNRLTIEDALANQVQSNEGNKQLFRMRINKKALRILNTPILDFAKVKWDKDDFWGVYEDFFSLDEMEYLSSLLTIYGDNIKVTEPKSMIEKIQRHLAKITNLYE